MKTLRKAVQNLEKKLALLEWQQNRGKLEGYRLRVGDRVYNEHGEPRTIVGAEIPVRLWWGLISSKFQYSLVCMNTEDLGRLVEACRWGTHYELTQYMKTNNYSVFPKPD